MKNIVVGFIAGAAVVLLFVMLAVVYGALHSNQIDMRTVETGCVRDAYECPDGSSVGRVAPNCDFAPCPHMEGASQDLAPVACTMDARVCPDGSSVGRVAPNCEFAACPGEK